MMNKKRISVLIMAGVLSLSLLCSPYAAFAEAISADSLPADAINSDSSQISQEDTYRPSEMGYPAKDSYTFGYLGLETVLPQELLKKMDAHDVLMYADEDFADDDSLDYAFLTWSSLTEEQKKQELKFGAAAEEYDEWLDSLNRIGTLGMYKADLTDSLDDLTGCTKHTEIGKTADGKYVYYLSVNEKADDSLTSLVEEAQTTLSEPVSLPKDASAFEEPRTDMPSSVGDFTTEDINGKEYTSDLFKENKLTLVNVFTTTCSPCVEEIPELEKLQKEMKEKGVGVVGVVLDVTNADGSVIEETLQKAQILAERAKATYPFLKPDETLMNGRLDGIQAFPETFFVDENGNIVSDPYLGSHSLEEWKSIVEDELSDLESGK